MVTRRRQRLRRLLLDPARIPTEVLYRWPWASFEQRLKWDALDQPGYAYGTYQAAKEARALGLAGISVIELGVAGGYGLRALTDHARAIRSRLKIEIDVFGFDTGSGMPQPRDYRDLPYVWKAGYFRMPVAEVRRSLPDAEIIIGDVAETVPEFIARPGLHPIGFAAFDLDYYSSTASALALLKADPSLLLPRVFCHFDDTIGDDSELHSEFTGAMLAISEFNACQSERKLAGINGLAYKRIVPADWNAKQYVLHCFSHPHYEKHLGPADWQLQGR